MKKFRQLIRHNRFLTTIMAAILIAIVWVIMSVSIYMVDGTHLLDLSRPGYEPAREQVKKDTTTQQAFPSSGAVDSGVLDDFLKRFTDRTHEIDQFDVFDSGALDETHLKIQQ